MIKGFFLNLILLGVSFAGSIEPDFQDAQVFLKGLGNQTANKEDLLSSLPKNHDQGEALYNAVQDRQLALNQLGTQVANNNDLESGIIQAGREGQMSKKENELKKASSEINQSMMTEANGSHYLNKESVYCHDGHCTNNQPIYANDFESSASKLLAVNGQAEELRQTRGQVKLFSGEVVECKMSAFNFLDCCHDKGWGKQLNLAKCSTKDKQLGVAKLTYRAHYIGSYCAKRHKIPGGSICRETRNTYCVFPTKIARIVREQGPYTQAAFIKTFGSAKKPDCTGFWPYELSVLNFTLINFKNPLYPFNEMNPFGEGISDEAGLAVDLQKRQFNPYEIANKVNTTANRGYLP